MSALALTLEASAARRSASEIIRSRLGKELERAEAAVVDPTASFKRRVEAWEYLSGQAADKLLKGSALSGGTALRDPWLATGAGTSPKTNELLENEKLLPNKALKALIVGELERRARARLG